MRLLILCTLALAAQAATWESLEAPLRAAIPGYADWPDKHYTRMGHLWTHPHSGDLYVWMNRDYGLYLSQDGGDSFARLDTPVLGRSFGCYGTHSDARSGNMALFVSPVLDKAFPQAQESLGLITRDGGQTWSGLPFRTSSGYRNGWSWGAVAWADDPATWLAKEHHTTQLWLTRDAGASWRRLEPQAKRFSLLDAQTILVAPEKGGILRSADGGASFAPVSDLQASSGPAVFHDGSWYWGCTTGLAVSPDHGQSWSVPGPAVEIGYGPWLSPDGSAMLMVSRAAYLLSRDLGRTWTALADRPGKDQPSGWNLTMPKESHAWNARRGIIYQGRVGSWPQRLRLQP
jgi:photosystem II stability/assembly factor-like uncharacterized protein